jgi:DNA repair protein RadA/Sms
MGEVDRVLGGGLVPGSVVLLAGDPGVGKSTLSLQLLAGCAASGAPTLLVGGEESPDQIAMRADRLGLPLDLLRVLSSTSVTQVMAASDINGRGVLVVDSIQTMEHTDEQGSAGSLAQVRTCAAALVRHAKSTGTAVVLIGHVTKEGSVAGPKSLEHVVDVVLGLEGDRSGALRLLRASKNRYGACDEAGVMRMGAAGLEAVPDPSATLLMDRRIGVPGSVIFPTLEGTRPLLVEVQALTGAEDKRTPPKRVGIGLDPKRISLILAVLSRHAGVKIEERDVFVALTGGLTVREPAADLSIALAVASTMRDLVVPPNAVVIGELGLAGEVRRVPGLEKRLAEARRLGFERAFVPAGCKVNVKGLDVIPVRDVAEALVQRLLAA